MSGRTHYLFSADGCVAVDEYWDQIWLWPVGDLAGTQTKERHERHSNLFNL